MGTPDRSLLGPRSLSGDDRTDHMLYHMVMARREVLVQLDDELIRRLDELAAEEGTSRSELLRRGAAAVLTAFELAAADRELQAAYGRVPQDPAIVEAAGRLASVTAIEW
jgi:metal-responsive CopG/Arc/MetJ family transcriptional regulator